MDSTGVRLLPMCLTCHRATPMTPSSSPTYDEHTMPKSYMPRSLLIGTDHLIKFFLYSVQIDYYYLPY